MPRLLFTSLIVFFSTIALGQHSLDDSLRGSITAERAWWDVQHYQIHLNDINAQKKSISGIVTIDFKVINEGNNLMQIDLQAPLQIDSVFYDNKTASQPSTNKLDFEKKATSVYLIHLTTPMKLNQQKTILIYYSGVPIEAKNAPWDGGIVWGKDKNGADFIASACQGIGASSWWPCKDHESDEPDNGATVILDTPKDLLGVSNGTLRRDTLMGEKRRTEWIVKNPINNYGISFNVANYASWVSIYKGEKGDLKMSFYVLPENLEKAKKQFNDANRMLEAFEHWFGPYPFYEDGYKLIEVPYLGMEHQSAISYGNKYQNGYLGIDMSLTGWGLKWDFIIIHESGHEWFGNSITAADIADMWIHEGFTTYSEVLFTEYFYGKEAGNDYAQGIRHSIENDKPIIADYNVHQVGSIDMYFKAANMLHTIRQIVQDDAKWLSFFRDLNREYFHQIVTSKEIETYMSNYFSIDLSSVFDQYLRTVKVPTLKLTRKKNKWTYQWINCIPTFDMPVDLLLDGKPLRVYPNNQAQKLKGKELIVDKNYYIKSILN